MSRWTMELTLTDRQLQVLESLHEYIELWGWAPTFRELAEDLRINSTNAVSEQLHRLQEMGLIRMAASPRAIALTKMGQAVILWRQA